MKMTKFRAAWLVPALIVFAAGCSSGDEATVDEGAADAANPCAVEADEGDAMDEGEMNPCAADADGDMDAAGDMADDAVDAAGDMADDDDAVDAAGDMADDAGDG